MIARRFEVIARAVRPPAHGVRVIVEIEHVGAAVAVEVDHEDALDVDVEGQRRRCAHAHRVAERSEAEVRPVGDGTTVDAHDVRRAVTGHVGEEHVRVGEVRRRTIGACGNDLRSRLPSAARRPDARAGGRARCSTPGRRSRRRRGRRGASSARRAAPTAPATIAPAARSRPARGVGSPTPARRRARRRRGRCRRGRRAPRDGVAGELRKVRNGAGAVPGATEIRPHRARRRRFRSRARRRHRHRPSRSARPARDRRAPGGALPASRAATRTSRGADGIV